MSLKCRYVNEKQIKIKSKFACVDFVLKHSVTPDLCQNQAPVSLVSPESAKSMEKQLD